MHIMKSVRTNRSCWQVIASLTALMLFLSLWPARSLTAAAGTWTEYPNNPVLTRGGIGSWDDWDTSSVSVVYDGGLYHMWYEGRAYLEHSQIGYATSSDGLHWTKQGGGPVLSAGADGSWDSNSVGQPCVRKDGSEWKMWYTAASSNGASGIGLATSSDGMHWTKSPANPVFTKGAAGSWDSVAVFRPSVLIEDGTYHMWYGAIEAIGYAHSFDGIHWTRSSLNPVLSPGPLGSWDDDGVYAPSVISLGGRYHLWYQGSSRSGSRAHFGHAEAADPEHWTRDLLNPVIGPGPSGSWDANGIYYPSVLASGGLLRMWFHGKANSAWNSTLSVGYADSPLPTSFAAYLPYVSNARLVVPPGAPVLNAIDNPTLAPSYDVTWSAVPGASSYTLREAGTAIYEGPDASYHVSNKPQGHYCYDVTAANSAGVSSPSNSVCTDVATEVIPRAGYWSNSSGSQWFTVSADRSRLVPGIRISIPACGVIAEIELTSGASINPTTHVYVWTGSFYGAGSFGSASSASGHMGLSYLYIYGCGYVSGGPYTTAYGWQHASIASTEALSAELVAADDGGLAPVPDGAIRQIEIWPERGSEDR